MEIDPNSWHYKMVRRSIKYCGDEHTIQNLCPYVRRLCKILIGIALLWTALSVVAVIAVADAVYSLLVVIGLFSFPVSVASVLCFVVGFMILIAGVALGIVALGIKFGWWVKLFNWLDKSLTRYANKNWQKKMSKVDDARRKELEENEIAYQKNMDLWDRYRELYRKAQEEGKPLPPYPNEKRAWRMYIGEPTLLDLIIEWMNAAHDKVCPILEVKKTS